MKVGVRAHDYGKRKIKELAALLHDEDYQAAQLALPKAFIGTTSMRISPRSISKRSEKPSHSRPWISRYSDATWT